MTVLRVVLRVVAVAWLADAELAGLLAEGGGDREPGDGGKDGE